MTKQVVTRTYRASIRNQRQVCDDLDSLGFAASKLWNVTKTLCVSVGPQERDSCQRHQKPRLLATLPDHRSGSPPDTENLVKWPSDTRLVSQNSVLTKPWGSTLKFV